MNDLVVKIVVEKGHERKYEFPVPFCCSLVRVVDYQVADRVRLNSQLYLLVLWDERQGIHHHHFGMDEGNGIHQHGAHRLVLPAFGCGNSWMVLAAGKGLESGLRELHNEEDVNDRVKEHPWERCPCLLHSCFEKAGGGRVHRHTRCATWKRGHWDRTFVHPSN